MKQGNFQQVFPERWSTTMMEDSLLDILRVKKLKLMLIKEDCCDWKEGCHDRNRFDSMPLEDAGNQKMWQQLSELAKQNVSSGRKKKMDWLLETICPKWVTDRELMDLIRLYASRRASHALLHLFAFFPRSRYVFKQFFPNVLWKNGGGEISWVCDCLARGGEKDLALFIAMNSSCEFLACFFHENMALIPIKKLKFRCALKSLYAFCETEFENFADYLSRKSAYGCRHLFNFALTQKNVRLAVRVCGQGIHEKDLSVAVDWMMEYHAQDFVNELRQTEPSPVRESLAQPATVHALTLLSDSEQGQQVYGFYCKIFLDLFEMTRDQKFRSEMFREGMIEFIKDDEEWHLWQFFTDYFFGADLTGDCEKKADCIFALKSALEAGKYKFINDTCHDYQECQAVLLDVVFRRPNLDTVKILQNVCTLRELCGAQMYKNMLVVLRKLCSLGSWQTHAQMVNEWMIRNASKLREVCLPCNALLPQLVSTFGTVRSVRISIAIKARWCMWKDYSHLAFVLAFAVQDWNTLKTLVIRKHYSPIFDLRRCIRRTVDVNQFSLAAALLSHCRPEAFELELRSEAQKDKLAAACLGVASLPWFVVFTVPRWDRLSSLFETEDHSRALTLALVESLKYKEWGFFEKYKGKCSDNSKVLKGALRGPQWHCVEQLMDECTSPRTLRHCFFMAVNYSKLDILWSVLQKVDPQTLIRSEGSILKSVIHFGELECHSSFQGHCTVECVSLQPILLCFLQAGVSTVDRSRVTSSDDCPLREVFGTNNDPEVVQLLIQSGAVSYQILHQFRSDRTLKARHAVERDGKWRQCYSHILEAAATPCSLKQLARLAVSDAVGCRPGRWERIEALPLPEPMKELVLFEDLTGEE